jgi:hypothetical protein
VLKEVIKIVEYAGMGCIFLGLIIIDGRMLGWLQQAKVKKRVVRTGLADSGQHRLESLD